jgi:hypothetical protein
MIVTPYHTADSSVVVATAGFSILTDEGSAHSILRRVERTFLPHPTMHEALWDTKTVKIRSPQWREILIFTVLLDVDSGSLLPGSTPPFPFLILTEYNNMI